MNSSKKLTIASHSEIEQLRARLEEAEETLRAIRHGEIDALIVKGKEGSRIYTLKGAEYTYRTLIESMSEGAVTYDTDGTILYCNLGFALLIKIPMEQVIGSSITSYFPDTDKKFLTTKNLNKKLKKETDLTVGRRTIPVTISVAHITLNDESHGFSMIVTDVSDQKKHEQVKIEKKMLENEVRTSRQLEKQKDDFLSMASHELKTPITSMKMFIELLYRNVEKGEIGRNGYFVERIRDQANRLKELTNDLLDVSRIQTGKLRLTVESFDITQVMSDTIEGLQGTTRKHTLVLKHNQKISVKGDRYRIYQVVVNLITNAIKYSPRGGNIEIDMTTDNKDAIISVRDYGIGIHPAQQQKIFDRLYQVTDQDSKTYPGLGLGLYISHEIVERHKGRMWVESEIKKGSTFYFTLPLAKKR